MTTHNATCRFNSCEENTTPLPTLESYIFRENKYHISILFLFWQAAIESVKTEEDDSLLKVFIELEETVPRLLRPIMEPILTFSLQVSGLTIDLSNKPINGQN